MYVVPETSPGLFKAKGIRFAEAFDESPDSQAGSATLLLPTSRRLSGFLIIHTMYLPRYATLSPFLGWRRHGQH